MREQATGLAWRWVATRIAAMGVIFAVAVSGGEAAVPAGDCGSLHIGCYTDFCDVEGQPCQGDGGAGCIGTYECWNECGANQVHLVCVYDEVE